MIEGDERNSLEGNDSRSGEPRQAGFTGSGSAMGLGLTSDEAWDLLDQLTQTLRIQGAVSPTEDNVDLTAEILAPRNRAVYVRALQSDARSSVLSWVPTIQADPTAAWTTCAVC